MVDIRDFKVGTKFKFTKRAEDGYFPSFYTLEKEYEIIKIDDDGDPVFRDNDEDWSYLWDYGIEDYGAEIVSQPEEKPKVTLEDFKVGTKFKFTKKAEDGYFPSFCTIGKVYEVVEINDDGDRVFNDNDGSRTILLDYRVGDYGTEIVPQSSETSDTTKGPLIAALKARYEALTGSLSSERRDIGKLLQDQYNLTADTRTTTVWS